MGAVVSNHESDFLTALDVSNAVSFAADGDEDSIAGDEVLSTIQSDHGVVQHAGDVSGIANPILLDVDQGVVLIDNQLEV